MERGVSASAAQLLSWHRDARRRTLALVAGLDEDQWMGPRLAIVNPMRWEVGHVAWFQEHWVLRHARGEAAMREDGDRLYDSSRVAHDLRWDLPLPAIPETLAYASAVLDRALARLRAKEPDATEAYFHCLAIFHEDMHDEAFTYTRQTLGYPPPVLDDGAAQACPSGAGPLPGDVEVPGGRFRIGASPDESGFVFDNEKWAHRVDVEPFRIARAAVSNQEFAAFVEDGGYRRRDLWQASGWEWRERSGAAHPVYWRRAGTGEWQRRHFDRWVSLEPHHPVIHVNWHEAQAWCRWAGRRLPSESEWEVAASGEPGAAGSSGSRRPFPWGDESPGPQHANLDGARLGCVEVAAFAEGDSAFGCRQMIGNVWEWTETDFGPYPGFVADPYKEYSEPWFGNHKVLRGGCWATRHRLLRNTWRNFYTPDRRDVFAGFRTCAPRRGESS